MKALVGHVHGKMLERYSHIRMAAKREAVDAITLPKAVNRDPMSVSNREGVVKRRLFAVAVK